MARSIPKEVKVKLAQQGNATVYNTFIQTAVFPDGTTMSLTSRTWSEKNKLQAEAYKETPKEKIKFEKKGDVML